MIFPLLLLKSVSPKICWRYIHCAGSSCDPRWRGVASGGRIWVVAFAEKRGSWALYRNDG